MKIAVNILRQFKIRSRLLLFLLLALVVSSTSIVLVTRTAAQALLRNYLYNYLKSTQEAIAASAELIIDEINMLAVRLTVNNEFYHLFNTEGLSFAEREEQFRQLLDRLLVHKELVGAIYIVDHNNEIYEYAPVGQIIQQPDLLDINRIRTSPLPLWGVIKKDQTEGSYILFGRQFYNFYTGESLGSLFIYIRESALNDVYRRIAPAGSFSFIVDDHNRVISHPDPAQVGSVIFDASIFETENDFTYKRAHYQGQPVILAISAFNNRLKNLGINWRMISVISEKEFFQVMDRINQIVLLIGTSILIGAAFLAIYVSFNLTKSVARLKYRLDQFGTEQVRAISTAPPNDELALLEESYDQMVLRVQELIEKNNREREKQRELELIALQAQINPHFIYNTLDAIGWIAKLKQQPEIEKLVIALATFFRISLHKGDKFITVAEEIKLVDSFVQVEQTRFPGKFEISYQIPEEMKECHILKIILQPLVENAIKHGIATKKGMGHIRIKGRKEGDDLYFEVIDDGVGFEVDSPDFASSYQKINYSGYGLRNVDERIKLEYGPEYGIRFMSEKGKGTTVLVKVRAGKAG
ncbi:MAG TPA: sensor histidine kinase [Firmicutes bacterium]|uniref:Sensor histidine kinase n=1 Tax=Capillibacterium thermochitinicola TaxID=2699427 RepID=A0A8J6HZA8_9FIRM|nr:sensor histidine kinase [Capillibacterium thermochitinicola]MBA2132403.1 sensor histidine kinase [Capillibacterium thermochitinicola]HHW12055.1 sensor histidine kinase [Bacillota bacterium]